MDKVLAFSILSASPADIAAGAGSFTTRLSWRRGADEPAANKSRQRRDGEKPGSPPPRRTHGDGGVKEPPAALLPRFAPEFDGIDCFETIVSH